jgi:hypothetical protein
MTLAVANTLLDPGYAGLESVYQRLERETGRP